LPRPFLVVSAAVLAALLLLLFFFPTRSHAVAGDVLPLRLAPETGVPIPWLDEIVAEFLAALVKVLQDLMKGVGILFWAALKLCGIVGLLGSDFSTLFGAVVVEAINAVVSGSIATVIRGSAAVSLGLLGLSWLARAFWPDLRVVSFQRIVVWGLVIQAYLLNAPGIYTQLEAARVDLAEEVAGAVSTGAVPGCSGSTVEIILCMTGTNSAEVQAPDLTALPDTIPPYGGAETVHDLYSHCVYNPPAYYGDPACDSDDPTGDPWEVLSYAQNALGSQALSLILGLLILAYGVLQMALGLAAGMMFVLFPVAVMFAFYLPLESFAIGVVRNYIAIFLKSVVLLTLAAVVIRLFTVAAGNLISLAAVGLIALLLCGIMAKEAVASLLSNVSFVGNSVSNLGAAFGLSGGGGGVAGQATPESRLAASMIGGPMAQTLLGAAHPYASSGVNLMGAAGSAFSAPVQRARAAVSTAVSAGTGGVGFLVGAAAAARGADFGSLALGSSAASILGGHDAAQGFTLGASFGALRRAARGASSPASTATTSSTAAGGGTTRTAAPASTATSAAPPAGSPTPAAAPASPSQSTTTLRRPQSPASSAQPATNATPAPAGGGTAPAVGAIQGVLGGQSLAGWTPAATQQIQATAARLQPASAEARQNTYDLMQASHDVAQRWEGEGRSPFLENGIVDPRFVDDVIQQAPAAARAFTVDQAKAGIPADQRLRLDETVTLGATQPSVAAPAAPVTPELHPATPAPQPAAPAAPAQPSTPAPETYDPALYEQLRTWRQAEAGREGKAAFHVFSDATLQRIAAARPQTEEDLLAVKGVGPKKLASFGLGVLDVTRHRPEEGDAT
jgi:hypothetical protein